MNSIKRFQVITVVLQPYISSLFETEVCYIGRTCLSSGVCLSVSGTGDSKLNTENMHYRDVSGGTHHVRNPSRPSPRFLYCKRQKLHVEARELGRWVCDCVYGSLQVGAINTTSSFARFARSATSPLCRAAAPQLRPLQLLLPARLHRSASTAAPHLYPLQLLLAACVRFSCCSRLRLFQLLPICVRFGCSSPIASASAAAPRLCPLQLLLPDCVHSGCCSPIVSASAAAPRYICFNCCSPIVSGSTAAP